MKYFTRSVGQILLLYSLIYAVLMIVFAIEQFDAVLKKAMEYDASLSSFLTLFFLTLPEVADFVVPVSVLISIYLVLLYKRENREFLILAAGGSDLRPVVMLVIAVASLFFVLSIAISGYLKPLSAHTYRSERMQLVAGFVSDGPRNGRFTRDGNRIFYVSDKDTKGKRSLRMFAFDDERLEKVMVSDCSNLTASQGDLIIGLCAARIYDFAKPPKGPATEGAAGDLTPQCRLCLDSSGNLDLTVIDIGQSTVLFPLNAIAGDATGLRRNERTLHGLLGVNQDGRVRSGRNFRDAALMLMLALASILAAAIAVVAVALTGYRNRFAVLPGAIALVMLTSVAASSGFAVPGIRPDLSVFIAAFGLALVSCLAMIPLAFTTVRSRLLMPGLGRP